MNPRVTRPTPVQLKQRTAAILASLAAVASMGWSSEDPSASSEERRVLVDCRDNVRSPRPRAVAPADAVKIAVGTIGEKGSTSITAPFTNAIRKIPNAMVEPQ